MFLAEKVCVDSWKTGDVDLQLNLRTEILFTNNTILMTVFCLASGPAPEQSLRSFSSLFFVLTV
jgi:hypothetical protein